MRRLPANQREVLVLHYLVELSLDEVATHLRVPGGTAGSRLARGRRALAKTLGLDDSQEDVAVLDGRLKQQLSRAAETARPPEPETIRRWGQTWRWRRAAVAVVVACALTGALVLASRGGMPKPEPAEPAGPIGTAPASFLASVGGRLALVSTITGRVMRYLTDAPAGQGQFFFALSEDRDTVWFSDVEVCGTSGLLRVPYQGGPAAQVDRSANAEGLAVLQDGSKLAYHPLGCRGTSQAIAVLDLRTGKKRTWSYSQRGEVLGSMAWSPEGRYLAYIEYFGTGELRSRAWLLDTTGTGTSLSARRPVPPPDKDCEIRDLAWQPGSSRLAISEACSSTDQLVFLDAPGGRVVSRPLRLQQPIAGLDFDPSGRHPLYTTGAQLRRCRPGQLGAGTAPEQWRSEGALACRCGDLERAQSRF